MSTDLVWGLIGTLLFVVLLMPAEQALMRMLRRHLDRSRRVMRALVFALGMGAWAYGSYLPLYRFSRLWWFFAFLVVAGVWKLVVDVVIFGRPDSSPRG